jgi:hypothetical protein
MSVSLAQLILRWIFIDKSQSLMINGLMASFLHILSALFVTFFRQI